MASGDRRLQYQAEIDALDRQSQVWLAQQTQATAVLIVGSGIAFASLFAHQLIGLMAGILAVIAGLVWRSDLGRKAKEHLDRRESLKRALDSLDKEKFS